MLCSRSLLGKAMSDICIQQHIISHVLSSTLTNVFLFLLRLVTFLTFLNILFERFLYLWFKIRLSILRCIVFSILCI